jgi:Ribbon-helix-helix protein, copG family
MSNFKKTRLEKMAIRLPPQQLEKLRELRDSTGVSVQDHIRRALDFYLTRPSKHPAQFQPPPELVAPLAESKLERIQSLPNNPRQKVVFR